MLLICVSICLITKTFSKPIHNEHHFNQLKDPSLAGGEHYVPGIHAHTSGMEYDVDCSDTSCGWVKQHPCHAHVFHDKDHFHAIHGHEAHTHPYLDEVDRCCENGAFHYVECINGHKFPAALHQHPQHHRAIHNHFQHSTREPSHFMPGYHNDFLRIWNQHTNQDVINNPFHRNQNRSQDVINTPLHRNRKINHHRVINTPFHASAHPIPLHVFGNLQHGIVDAPYPENVLDMPIHTMTPKNGSTYADVAATLTDVPVTVPTVTHGSSGHSWPANVAASLHPLPWHTGEGPTNSDVLDSLANVNVNVVAPYGAHTNTAPVFPIASHVGATPSHTGIQADVVPSLTNFVATVPNRPIGPVNIAADAGVTPAHTNVGLGDANSHASLTNVEFTVQTNRPNNLPSDLVVTPSQTIITDADLHAHTNVASTVPTDVDAFKRNVNILCGRTRITLTRAVIVQEGIDPANTAAVLQRFCSASVPAHVGGNAGVVPVHQNSDVYVTNIPIRGNVSADAEADTDDIVATSANVRPAHITAPSHPAVLPLHTDTEDTDTDDDVPVHGIELSTDAEKIHADIHKVASLLHKKDDFIHKRLQ